ncbi:hypothetical protein FJ527_17860 [Mesorhizobium sp. B2-4-18]|nr:hypothetical protein FJ527_17860 [Mesorhizobium sp. B2-4-18]TPL65903.1 hypothetical protein FJ954_27275 [Mesorhizobium sp. B2-3-15]
MSSSASRASIAGWSITAVAASCAERTSFSLRSFSRLRPEGGAGETLTPRRVGACAGVALGAICLGYQP